MKLEVGMYYRTDKGWLDEIVEIIDMSVVNGNEYYRIKHTRNAKHKRSWARIKINKCRFSHNIIDLIEVGDYVNGYEVYSVYKKGVNSLNNVLELSIGILYEKEITSVVTKEQFESMEYKIGE